MMHHIVLLGACPQYLETLAAWHDRQWRHLNDPAYTLQKRCDEYRGEYGPGVPFMLVAHDGATPLGSVRVVMQDMEHQSLRTPWLASLYVHPSARGCGIGRYLVEHACDHSRTLGIKTLYLFSEVPAYFHKLGWRREEETEYHGSRVVVFSRTL